MYKNFPNPSAWKNAQIFFGQKKMTENDLKKMTKKKCLPMSAIAKFFRLFESQNRKMEFQFSIFRFSIERSIRSMAESIIRLKNRFGNRFWLKNQFGDRYSIENRKVDKLTFRFLCLSIERLIRLWDESTFRSKDWFGYGTNRFFISKNWFLEMLQRCMVCEGSALTCSPH